jgi:RNA polymerase sigma-70 factor (ECF subfamily)
VTEAAGFLATSLPRASLERGAPPSDSEIVAGLNAGHAWAADALYERVHGVVRQTLRRVVGPHDSELTDLVNGVFERLIVTLSDRGLGDVSKLEGWAAAVTTHFALDVLRARTRRRRLVLFDDDWVEQALPEGPSLERSLEARAEVARLRQVLARMPAARVETLILHDVLGHSLEEIAALTSVSKAAAQSRLSRGRRELARRLNLACARGGR